MTKCTSELTFVVRVEVTGEKREFPLVPDDGGLVQRLQEWLFVNKIIPAVRGGESGGGRYIAYHTEEDAKRIATWLEEKEGIKSAWCRPDCLV